MSQNYGFIPMTMLLSLDLLVQIVERVHDPRDRKSARLACRAFLRAEALSRRRLRALRRDPLPRLLRLYVALDHLDLSVCPLLDDAFLSTSLAGPGPLGQPPGPQALKSVCLARASGIGWRGLEALVAACPRLEIMDLSHCTRAGDREAAAVAEAKGLRELKLDKCLGVTDVGLAKVAVGCPRLEKLGIKWCLEISDIGLELLAKKCRELRSLDISYLKVSNESLRSISTLEKLEDLAMVGCSYIDDEGLKLLGEGGNSLLNIDVSRCDHVTPVGVASLISGHQRLQKINAGDCFHELAASFLSKLNLLRGTLNVLKLDGCTVSDSGLEAIGLSCKMLVEVGLTKCSDVTDEGISALVASCNNVKIIDLTCCNEVTDIGLMGIAENCRKLESLRLESCSRVTEKGLEHVATYCPSLQEIDLTDCNVNDAALYQLSRCSELVILKLALCSSISNQGLAYISSSCKKLQELDLYRCSAITDDGIAALAAGCKQMRKLNLCYCNQISDTGLKYLSSLDELSDLELRCLVRISSVGITTIAMGCKSLVELDLKRCYAVDDAGLWALAQYAQKLRQLTISYCQVTGLGLCHLLGSLRCLQDVKLVHLTWVSFEGFEIALRASCGRLKKLKLLVGLRNVLSPELLQMLQASGCRIRWVNKPLVYKG